MVVAVQCELEWRQAAERPGGGPTVHDYSGVGRIGHMGLRGLLGLPLPN